MNAKVQEFIDKKKAEQREKALKQRNEHLISLGLIDEEKCIESVVYLDELDKSAPCQWDLEKQKYVKKTYIPVPIEVTDEEYQEILKYAPITEKESVDTKKSKVSKSSGGYSKVIMFAAKVFFVTHIALLAGLLYLWHEYPPQTGEDWVFFGVMFTACVFYFLFWHPIISGYATIVKAAEKSLREE
ncbi:MAG: hypothetical protein II288_00060 [Alistipes sp.]|nr:hypothetical protein [Alistipes sp.]